MTATPPDPGITIGATGAVAPTPAFVWSQLVAYLESTVPGYTVLPGVLIEDILSTDVAAIVECAQAAVEAINSLTPNDANPWLLYLLGQIYGVVPGQTTNTSVFVVFSGTVGFTINPGFTVTDGTYHYVIQDGGIIESGGASAPLYAVATIPGSWPVPANTVTGLVTSKPSTITLTVTNPSTGTPSAGSQTTAEYRALVIQAGQATAQGMPKFLKKQLTDVPGVQANLVSVQPQAGGGWLVMVGGGDPYAVAYAIFRGIGDISTLVGSTIAVTGVTNATLGVVTTDLNHGLATGQSDVHIAGVVGMSGVNGGPYTVDVLTPNTFTFGANTTGSGLYESGGVVTPNNRNIVVSIQDYPDTDQIPFVIPPAQAVVIQLSWGTSSPNFVSPVAVAQLGAPALAAYVNAVAVGQPINLFALQETFQLAIASLIPPAYLTRMIFTVSINGVDTSPESGTGIIAGDPQSYFTCSASAVTITQG